MAASPIAVDDPSVPRKEKWQSPDKQADVVQTNGVDAASVEPRPSADEQAVVPPAGNGAEPSHNGSAATEANPAPSSTTENSGRGEKQIKPNKVYIGGLPELTRKEDLEGCFGKIGTIVNIELKHGYGFVEFDTREAAEESVAKYHEGYFMGNKIRVELSHGGGRTAKYSNDPGACFKCGQVGHWARECPNLTSVDPRRGAAPLIDRIQAPRDYYPREYYDYARPPPPRDPRYPYDYPPPPMGREYRRPPTPPRDYRDYPPRVAREPEDYRSRPPPLTRPDARPGYYPPETDVPPPTNYARYPPRDYYDRYDRRPPPAERYAPYPAPPRDRSPPVPSRRDDYERPSREYPPPSEYRSRPASPPPSRYADYPRGGSSEPTRYRRRSQSPPLRSAGYDSAYPSGAAPYNGTSGSYAGAGYSRDSPSRGASSTREYPPSRSRDGDPGYRRI